MSLSASGRTWEEAVVARPPSAWPGGSRPPGGRAAPRPPPRPRRLPARRRRGRRPAPGSRCSAPTSACGWEAGEPVGAEWYRDRYPDLGDETLRRPDLRGILPPRGGRARPPTRPSTYARFPEVAARLRRVLDIHGLVGSGADVDRACTSPGAAGGRRSPRPGRRSPGSTWSRSWAGGRSPGSSSPRSGSSPTGRWR